MTEEQRNEIREKLIKARENYSYDIYKGKRPFIDEWIVDFILTSECLELLAPLFELHKDDAFKVVWNEFNSTSGRITTDVADIMSLDMATKISTLPVKVKNIKCQ